MMTNSEVVVIWLPNSKTMGEHMASGIYYITLKEEFAKISHQ